MRNGEASLGLRYFPDSDPKLDSILLGSEKLFVVVPALHRIVAHRLPDLHELKGERWLGFPPDRRQPESFGHLLERELIASGCVNPSITSVDSLTAQKRLIEAGLGIGLMPKSSIREELRIGSLRTIEIESLPAGLPVALVRRKCGYQSQLAKAFVKLLKDYTPDLREE